MAATALKLLAPFLVFGAKVLAQRPENVSICDYYTEQKYGEASPIHQYHMIQGIVSLAFAGSSSLRAENVSEKITGILNPGKEEETGTDINLEPWFNGSIPSSNLNNQAIGIDWLDDGGVQPLLDYLSNKTGNVTLRAESNEFRLFGHFFTAFSRVFGCSSPVPPIPSTKGPVSLAYAHKFMNLNHTQLSYFIDQLTMSAEHFGFSPQDANTINQSLNSRYNVRCAPAVAFNPQSKPQLLSLCQHPTCPLAAPQADCPAYVNLTAEGTSGDTNTQPPSSLAPTTITTGLPSEQVPTEVPPSPSPSADPKDDDKALGAGPIAGIAIGGVATLLLAVALLIWWRKRSKPSVPSSVGPSTTTHQTVSEWANDPKNPASPYAASEVGGGGAYFNGGGGGGGRSGYATPSQTPGSPSWGPVAGYGSMSPHQQQVGDQHGSWQWTPNPGPRPQEMGGAEVAPMSPQEMVGEGGLEDGRNRRMSPLSR